MPKWPRRQPSVDEHSVGINFVGFLFALVVARVLEPFAEWNELSVAGITHLVVAGVLVLTSWIGYHNSLNRPRYFIRFPNLPLAQFLIDVALVVVYWLTAVTAEEAGERQSSTPEIGLVAAAFVLFVMWDRVAFRIRKAPEYSRRVESRDVPARRQVTERCAGLAVALAVVAVLWDDQPLAVVVTLDALLVALLVGFRFWKEYVTPSDVAAPDPGQSPQRSGAAGPSM